MLTRRESVLLTAKGLAGLLAAAPFLGGCSQADERGARSASGREDGLSPPPAAEVDAGIPSPALDQGSGDPVDASAPSGEMLSWEDFLAELSVLAEQQFSPTWDQDAYVEEVAALMGLLHLEDESFQALYDGYATAGELFPELQTVHEGGYFEVATLEFDAGDEISLHNHPDMTGVILCLSGRLEVEAFDLQERQSASGALLLERVVQRELEPGDYCTLTATHGNIHSVRAQSFTQLLDIFTPPYDDERLTRYRWYERAAEPYEGEDLFEAWER